MGHSESAKLADMQGKPITEKTVIQGVANANSVCAAYGKDEENP